MDERGRHVTFGDTRRSSQDRPTLATPIPVIAPDDPRLAAFKDIRERDIVGRQGRFIAEGDVVLRMLLDAPSFAVESVLVSARVAEAGRPWFDLVPDGVALLAVDDALMEEVAGFHVHRGILAVARRREAQDPARLLGALPERATVLAAIGIANHDNMGGLFRNAAAFGVDAMICDRTCCDPLYRKAIRVSVGGVFRVPFARGGNALSMIEALEAAGFECFGFTPSAATLLTELEPGPRIALVLGAEGPGLPQEVLARLRPVRIGMAPGFDSLNVAAAGAIALHHLFNR
jgi:tRNA G18 (ribose-2'-O)-methylase SpoU